MSPGKGVRIAVLFEPGKKARPVWFELNRRQHRITESTYHWQDRVGERQLLHYAVTDGEALYELVFDPADQSWTIHSQRTE
jgi:hypothetical protein